MVPIPPHLPPFRPTQAPRELVPCARDVQQDRIQPMPVPQEPFALSSPRKTLGGN